MRRRRPLQDRYIPARNRYNRYKLNGCLPTPFEQSFHRQTAGHRATRTWCRNRRIHRNWRQQASTWTCIFQVASG